MYTLSHKSSLEALMDVPYRHIADFGLASTAIRSELSCSEGVVLIPQRGASPLTWAAEGLPDFESSPYANATPQPVAVGTYFVKNGTKFVQNGSTKPARYNMLEAALDASPEKSEGITVLDEVQMGGTLANLVRDITVYRRIHGGDTPVRAVAAVDTMRAWQRGRVYRRLVDGHFNRVSVTPIPTPLIATDRDALLPGLEYHGEIRTQETHEDHRRFTVVPNPQAELLMRCIGTVSRVPELSHESSAVESIVESTNTTQQPMVRQWVAGMLAVVNQQADRMQ